MQSGKLSNLPNIKNLSNINLLKNLINKTTEFGSETDPNSNIFFTFNFFKNQKDYFDQNLQQTINAILDYKNQIQQLEDNIKRNEIAIQILEELKKIKIDTNKQFILSVINTALADIFQDDLKIDIIQENERGKIKYRISLIQAGVEIGSNDQLLNTNGGGVLSVISVLFKILIGYLYSKNKFFIFDESFSQVSPEYRERLSLFLRKFAEKYGFTIVIVSQTSDLNTYAHVLYKVNYKYEKIKNKKEEINIKTMYIEEKIENESDNITEYFYADIENFQSIKKISFEYKGLTIISGPNNCGKSASLRALKSVIFNDFKPIYLRMGAKECKIKFGKKIVQKKSILDHSITLIYKSKKVIFEINGEQYLGKNLAADILKSEIEKIGFKYIDIKKLYKNIKGDLRNQVENIAYASQYDSLFLVSNKSNDIEKVFNFLFNTEKITAITIEYKEKIADLKNQINDINKFLVIEKTKENDYLILINFITYYLNYLQYKVYQFLKNQIKNINKDIQKRQHYIKNIKQLLDKYSRLSREFNSLIKYSTLKNQLDLNKKLIKEKQLVFNQADKLLLNSPNFDIIDKIFQFKKITFNIKNKKESLNKFNSKYQNLLTIISNYKNLEIEKLFDLSNKKISLLNLKENYANLTQTLEKKQKELIEINEEIKQNHLIECPHCHGLGWIKK